MIPNNRSQFRIGCGCEAAQELGDGFIGFVWLQRLIVPRCVEWVEKTLRRVFGAFLIACDRPVTP